MKATLEFNLPDEQMEFNRVTQSVYMAYALFDIFQLRSDLEQKYWDIDVSDTSVFDGIEQMANGISEILDKYNIDIYKLIQ